jgi:hypothetical protein
LSKKCQYSLKKYYKNITFSKKNNDTLQAYPMRAFLYRMKNNMLQPHIKNVCLLWGYLFAGYLVKIFIKAVKFSSFRGMI